MAADEITHLHASIEGYVQGVSFRYYVMKMATSLNINGWVRNLYDGRVEVVAEGPRSALDKLLAALHQGPPQSMVTAVDYDWLPPTNEFQDFKVRPTV